MRHSPWRCACPDCRRWREDVGAYAPRRPRPPRHNRTLECIDMLDVTGLKVTVPEDSFMRALEERRRQLLDMLLLP